MKFTLKDYQEEAVADVLSNMHKAARRWHQDGDIHAFSLTATTGAGKTVMAAAVFETLFYGDEVFDFEADPSAVVIWFSDDPSLNEQTRFRLIEASDKLDILDLVVVGNTFNREKFQAGKIYFLNTQKLSKTSLLVRGHQDIEEIDPAQQSFFSGKRPDLRAYTIWDTIQNTVEDPSLTLYLVLDEAHRGMGKNQESIRNEKSTIVKKLINGFGSIPPIPIVWGISATVKRFNEAVEKAEARSTLPNVIVDSVKVQDSGLLKDTIILDIPEKAGQFDTVLVRRATEKIKESTSAWLEYSKSQNEKEVVIPLMVLQVPNTPNSDDVGRALDTIYSEWPELGVNAIGHVFGEHKTQIFGRHIVPYITPQRVQETPRIRVLIAKDAISTGWDCPRAEVMVSFRPVIDRTHITQLLGRMVRTPLARRIPGNDRLNAVDCLLPFFDSKSVEIVADVLMSGSVDDGDSRLLGRRVLINPIEVIPNPEVPEEVWECLESLTSQSLPKKGAKPIKRLTALAQELASDGLVPDAGKKAHAEMHRALDDAHAKFYDQIAKARETILVVEGKSLVADLKGKNKSFNEFVENADYNVVNDFYRRATLGISSDLARTYAHYIANRNKNADSLEEAILEAYTDIASIGLVTEIQDYLDSEADRLSLNWLDANRLAIKQLSDDRQESYRSLRSWSKEPEDIELVRPVSWIVATKAVENQIETKISRYQNHLMCETNDNFFPCDMNEWEIKVLNFEMRRTDFVAWYRNPGHASQDSLGISYQENKAFRIMRPDFLFFRKNKEGNIVVDIVDPHGHHLSDSLPKLKGLASFAQSHKSIFQRIESVAKIAEKLRILDLTKPDVREAVLNAESAKALYESSFGQDY